MKTKDSVVFIIAPCCFTFLLTCTSLAQNNEVQNKNTREQKRCHITVLTERKSGEKTERLFGQNFKTETECKKSAKRYGINFNPAVIKKVNSTYVWDKK